MLAEGELSSANAVFCFISSPPVYLVYKVIRRRSCELPLVCIHSCVLDPALSVVRGIVYGLTGPPHTFNTRFPKPGYALIPAYSGAQDVSFGHLDTSTNSIPLPISTRIIKQKR